MSLSIIYTLIARANKIILTDFTEYSGNFQQISLVILNKIKKNTKCSVEYNDYTFFYEDESDITFLCVAENMKDDVAFSFLSDIKKKFFSKYELKTILTSFSYNMRDFSEEIKSIVNFYEDNPNHTNIGVLKTNLNETIEVVKDSVDKLLERNEKLNIIAQKSKKMLATSDDIRATATYVKKKQRAGCLRCVLILTAIILILGLILYFAIGASSN